MNVNNLLEGARPNQVLHEQAGKLAGKWDRSGLLEVIETSTEKNNMAMLLENQAKQLVNEAGSATSTGASFSAGNSEAWAGVALPLVRRVFGEIVAKDLISVQPMNLPAGLIFYLDFQYGTNQHGFTKGESIMGKTGPYSPSGSSAPYADGTDGQGFYGAGRYGYTVNSTSLADITATDGGVPSYKDINFNSDVSASYGTGRLRKFTYAISTTVASGMDKLAARSFAFGSGSSGMGSVLDGKVLSEFTFFELI